MGLSLFLSKEETGGFYHVLSLNLVPLEVSRVALCGNTDGLAIDDEKALLNIAIDGAGELTVHGVVLEHVSQIVNRAEVVDTYNLDVVAVFYSCTENEATDTAESVNTYFNHWSKECL